MNPYLFRMGHVFIAPWRELNPHHCVIPHTACLLAAGGEGDEPPGDDDRPVACLGAYHGGRAQRDAGAPRLQPLVRQDALQLHQERPGRDPRASGKYSPLQSNMTCRQSLLHILSIKYVSRAEYR